MKNSKNLTVSEIRKLTPDDMLNSVNMSNLIQTIKDKYTNDFPANILTDENIHTHIYSSASVWVGNLKSKTTKIGASIKGDITEIYNSFEDYVIARIAKSFDYDIRYFAKIHRLPNSAPLIPELTAKERYIKNKTEIDAIADKIEIKIKESKFAYILYNIECIPDCIITTLMYHTENPVFAIQNYLYDEIIVPYEIFSEINEKDEVSC